MAQDRTVPQRIAGRMHALEYRCHLLVRSPTAPGKPFTIAYRLASDPGQIVEVQGVTWAGTLELAVIAAEAKGWHLSERSAPATTSVRAVSQTSEMADR